MSPAPVTQSSSPEPEPEVVEQVEAAEPDEAAEAEAPVDEAVAEPVTREADPVTEAPEFDESKRTVVHQTSPEEEALDLSEGDDFTLDIGGVETDYVVLAHDRAARRLTLQPK